MIRRELRAGLWQVIEQREHARISGELARAWNPVGLLADNRWREELLFAITHHDDGWIEWDSLQGYAPSERQSLAFDEMQVTDSLKIWTQSILLCGDRGPLAGFAVAGHFLRLAREGRHAVEPAVVDWCKETSSRQAAFLAEPGGPSMTEAHEGTQWVRALDWFSLWLCLHSNGFALGNLVHAFTAINLPLSTTPMPLVCVGVLPRADDVGEAFVSPWPFADDALCLKCQGRLMLEKQLTTGNWRTAQVEPIRWRLIPLTATASASSAAAPTVP